jgi:putative ABC transport system ATP-binding protein
MPSLPLISMTGVAKAYESAAAPVVALHDVNLNVERGEFVAVIGKSGSGKTTLINLLTGIDAPSAGSIRVASTDVHTLDQESLSAWRGRSVGIVFQFFQLLPSLTVAENVMLPMDFCNMYTPRERPERAMQLLAQVEMAEQAHKLPSAVSGGQQQRVAIARALANDPPVLIADEPTGNLDSSSSAEVLSFLRRSVSEHGQSIVMVTHDPRGAAYADRVVFLADGKVVGELISPTADSVLEEMRKLGS